MKSFKNYILCMAVMTATSVFAQEPFWLGADISGTTALEAHGGQLFNAQGEKRENTQLMKDYGLNAVRLRVWVNPKDGFCNKEDVLVMAKRAKAHDMAIMIDFHYSDWWADPAKQNIPEAWKELDYKQMKKALAKHTRETLQLLKDNDIDVKWVQVGNETTHGFLWDMGRAEKNMKQYAGLSDAGYAAVKKVYPKAICIVHLDGGCDIKRYHFIFNGLKQYKSRYDMIGLSNADEPEKGKKFLSDLIEASVNQTEGHCKGVFYWAPELEGHYKLGAFRNHRPTVIMDAYKEASLKLSDAK